MTLRDLVSEIRPIASSDKLPWPIGIFKQPCAEPRSTTFFSIHLFSKMKRLSLEAVGNEKLEIMAPSGHLWMGNLGVQLSNIPIRQQTPPLSCPCSRASQASLETVVIRWRETLSFSEDFPVLSLKLTSQVSLKWWKGTQKSQRERHLSRQPKMEIHTEVSLFSKQTKYSIYVME